MTLEEAENSTEATEATQATQATETAEDPEVEEEDDAYYENKFMLLDRLFQFVQQEGELNPVLSGYFCKLVSLLNSRKQKMLVPYIFSPESNIVDKLIEHVYQKSISEILNKLLTQFESDYDQDVLDQIKAK